MDKEAVARAAGVIPGQKLSAFLEYIVRTPEFPGLVDRPHPEEERLQGDIVSRFPLCLIDASGKAKASSEMVALINNTCDLQPGRSHLVNVALVLDFKEYRDSIIQSRGKAKAEGFLSAVQKNKVAEILYVAQCPGFESGVAILLDHVASVSVEVYDQALRSGCRVASFTQNGFYVFLLKVANFYARAETPDVAR